ncbi:helix-turn-helix domain-containing protein [Enterococcus sp. DIV0840c]|uniref:helix-turn-helix domain-containing protein n=1 Tax=Enterococcus sp. DIV0840c TaxID=2774772 RepID=UPI003D27E956
MEELLFYQIVINQKTQRWFRILDRLEQMQVITASDLANQLQCTVRTVQSDIKGMKDFFSEEILLIGDDQGYHFSFLNPNSYTEKKQKLLDTEPCFLLLDQIFSGIERRNQEWANLLQMSSASFSRLKRTITTFLKEHYQVRIASPKNKIIGEEASIRQLMYDFYFGLPLYPISIKNEINHFNDFESSFEDNRWSLNEELLKQWITIFSLRINQGFLLPTCMKEEIVKKKLAKELDQLKILSIPSHEKAALFLLSLKEDLFLNPLKQKEFLKTFCTYENKENADDRAKDFLRTILHLTNTFFQLPKELTNSRIEKKKFAVSITLEEIMDRYKEVKQHIEYPVTVSFALEGSNALQQWIKQQVTTKLTLAGYSILKTTTYSKVFQLKNIHITNKKVTECYTNVLSLSKIPTEEEVDEKVIRKRSDK